MHLPDQPEDCLCFALLLGGFALQVGHPSGSCPQLRGELLLPELAQQGEADVSQLELGCLMLPNAVFDLLRQPVQAPHT
eukprot:10096577-Prorocentrum_lima.AAC.1